MNNIQSRARVFISSGQAKGSDEVEVAKGIAAELERLGFDPYIAVQQQSLRGIRENIFCQLENSEYFVFVDFKREPLGNTGYHRGSVFCQQELAIASYLELPFIALREEGVKPEEGLLGFVQGNCISFQDRHLIAAVVAHEVQKRGWSPYWRNELRLCRDMKEYQDAKVIFKGQPSTGRFYHIKVQNRHPVKTARNCYAYINEIRNVDNGKIHHRRPIELKWAGYVQPNAVIGPGSDRMFDGIWVCFGNPTEVQFQAYCDSTEYLPFINSIGKYQLEYMVMSENFSTAKISCRLDVKSHIEDIVFKECD